VVFAITGEVEGGLGKKTGLGILGGGESFQTKMAAIRHFVCFFEIFEKFSKSFFFYYLFCPVEFSPHFSPDP